MFTRYESKYRKLPIDFHKYNRVVTPKIEPV
jgi:hypothetical protein